MQYREFEIENLMMTVESKNKHEESQYKSENFSHYIEKFLSDCYCSMRSDEGFIIKLNNDGLIPVRLDKVKKICFGSDFFAISFLSEKKETILIKYDSILYFKIVKKFPDNKIYIK